MKRGKETRSNSGHTAGSQEEEEKVDRRVDGCVRREREIKAEGRSVMHYVTGVIAGIYGLESVKCVERWTVDSFG
jgi:hypothetical protein